MSVEINAKKGKGTVQIISLSKLLLLFILKKIALFIIIIPDQALIFLLVLLPWGILQLFFDIVAFGLIEWFLLYQLHCFQ